MKLRKVLEEFSKIDKRRKIAKEDIFLRSTLQRIEKDGYVIAVYYSVKDIEINKVVDMTFKKLRRFNVEKFHLAGRNDKPVSMENLISSCKKEEIFRKVSLSIFFTVRF